MKEGTFKEGRNIQDKKEGRKEGRKEGKERKEEREETGLPASGQRPPFPSEPVRRCR
jgi:hypothetical protein